MKIIRLFAIVLYGVSLSTADLHLARDGEPTARILLPEVSGHATIFAAEELRDHIELISGARLPVLATDRPVENEALVVLNPLQLERDLELTCSHRIPDQLSGRIAPLLDGLSKPPQPQRGPHVGEAAEAILLEELFSIVGVPETVPDDLFFLPEIWRFRLDIDRQGAENVIAVHGHDEYGMGGLWKPAALYTLED